MAQHERVIYLRVSMRTTLIMKRTYHGFAQNQGMCWHCAHPGGELSELLRILLWLAAELAGPRDVAMGEQRTYCIGNLLHSTSVKQAI